MTETYNIIRPVGLKPAPDKYEEKVAELCAKWFRSDIAFVLRSGHTTTDIKVLKTGQFWEIKNIKGCGNHTIEDNLRKASKQSQNVIISLLASKKMSSKQAKNRISYVLGTKRMPIKKVLLITKNEQVIDIK